MRSVNPTPKEKYAVGFDVREYELMSNLDGRRYQDVYVINMQTGDRKLALKKARNINQPSTCSSSSRPKCCLARPTRLVYPHSGTT